MPKMISLKMKTRAVAMAASLLAATVTFVSFGQVPENRGLLLQQQPTTLMNARASCTISQLQMTFKTGNDDMRGNGNDLNVEIHFGDGNLQLAKNVNHSQGWPNNSSMTVSVPLEHPIAPNQIKSLKLIHLAQGSFRPNANVASPEIGLLQGIQTEDNWDMSGMQADGVAGNLKVPIATAGSHRFTGSNPSFDVNAIPNIGCPSPDQATQLTFIFQTGNDDLRGGHDNLNIAISGDGLTQQEMDVNQGQSWSNGSTHEVHVMLNHPMSVSQIHRAILATTFQGGSGGDNWNMDSVKIYAVVNGANQLIATQGFYRFSGPPGNRLEILTK
jgi:hypothetical protein